MALTIPQSFGSARLSRCDNPSLSRPTVAALLVSRHGCLLGSSDGSDFVDQRFENRHKIAKVPVVITVGRTTYTTESDGVILHHNKPSAVAHIISPGGCPKRCLSTATRSADSAYRDDEAYALLDRVKHCCLFDDDDGGIGVTEDPQDARQPCQRWED